MAMKYRIALLLVLVGGLVMVGLPKRHDRGGCVGCFGIVAPWTPKYVNYFAPVPERLDAYLKSLGFTPTTEAKHCGRYIIPGLRQTFYVGSYRGSPPLEVSVIYREDGSAGQGAGIEVGVGWGAKGSAEYVDSVEALAKELSADLQAWWEQYQRDNGRPWSQGEGARDCSAEEADD
jgi:hypothetical protein